MRLGYTGWTFLISVMSPPDPPSRTGPDPARPPPMTPADPAADPSSFGARFATSVFSAVFFGSDGFGVATVADMTPAGPGMYAAMPADGVPAVRTRPGCALTCVSTANNR